MNEEPEPGSRAGRWASGGAIVAAIAASSCCILPVVLGASGLSTAAFAGAFESARPYLLVVTTVLLGAGFYNEFFRNPTCEPGEACSTPRPKLRRFNRGMLSFSTLAVLALAFFPSYASVFAGDRAPDDPALASTASQEIVLAVRGMTCEACTIAVQNELAAVPGVLRSAVDFEAEEAVVLVRADAPPSTDSLLAAVDRAGYSAVLAKGKAGQDG